MEKKKEFIINIVYIALIGGLIYVGVNYFLTLLFPFILGFIFAYAARKICRRIFNSDSNRYRQLTLAAIYLIIVVVIYLLVSLGINKLGDFITTLPNFYRTTVDPYINSLESTIMSYTSSLPANVSQVLAPLTDGLFDGLKSIISTITGGLVNITGNIIAVAPNAFVSIIVVLVASFYIVSDYESIISWCKSSIPSKYLDVLYEIKDFIENVLLKILSSYLSIMFITFLELLIGFSIIKLNNGPMWAVIISFLDILPVLGVGTVLIPWGVSSLITGRFLLGIELLVLYVIITVVRNIIEPRFVGTNLNLHPLAALMSMIVGLRLFGAIGMFGLPLAISFFVTRSKKNQ